jgi:hypothetical protein
VNWRQLVWVNIRVVKDFAVPVYDPDGLTGDEAVEAAKGAIHRMEVVPTITEQVDLNTGDIDTFSGHVWVPSTGLWTPVEAIRKNHSTKKSCCG